MSNFKLIQEQREKFLKLALIFAFTGKIFAQSGAQIQIAVATPDPAKAGETVTFQIIAINLESKTWKKGEISARVEVFDENGKYLKKTSENFIESDVVSGGTALFLVGMQTPQTYLGRYQFRVILSKKAQTLLVSDFFSFNVRAAALKKKEKKYYLSGNAYLSYKFSQELSNQGSFSANLLSRFAKKTFLFNLNSYSTSDDPIDVDNVLFSAVSERWKVSLGDVMPDFSYLSIYSQTGRGISFKEILNPIEISLCHMRIQNAAEGSQTENGVFSRYTLGTDILIKPFQTLHFGFSGILNYDKENSIQTRGPSLDLYKNSVLTGRAALEFSNSSFVLEFAQGNKDIEDIYGVKTSSSGTGIFFKGNFSAKIFDLTAEFSRIEEGFLNFAAPGIYPDRLGWKASSNIYPARFLRFSLSNQYYHDNLEEKENVLTTNQNISQAGISVMPRKLPTLSSSFSKNKVWGDDKSILENETTSIFYGITYYIGGHSIAVNSSLSQFRNFASTTTSNDLDTNSIAFNYSGRIFPWMSFDCGFSNNITKNLSDNSEDKNISISASSNITLSKKTSLFVYSSNSKRDYPANNTKTITTNLSVEFNWKIKEFLTSTFGYTLDKNDELDDSNDYTSTGGILRLNLRF